MPDLNMRQINGLAYAKQSKRLTNGAYQKLNSVSHDVAKRDLAAMVEKGRLKAVGYNKSTYYVPERESTRPDSARSAPGS
jgi:predicted HTH transcriptional regulator